MRKFKCTALVMLSLLPVCGLGAHNPLLPRPQEITFGSERLAVRGLGIGFASAPSPEDRFAAEELSKWLGERASVEIPIRESKGAEPAIVLGRTGGVDALPMPGE